MTISVRFRADFKFFGVIVTLKIKPKYTRVSFCTSVQFFAKKIVAFIGYVAYNLF
jgi:hypothetical protein